MAKDYRSRIFHGTAAMPDVVSAPAPEGRDATDDTQAAGSPEPRAGLLRRYRGRSQVRAATLRGTGTGNFPSARSCSR